MLPPRALIGMVHLRALPGAPSSQLSVDQLVDLALSEARILVSTGFDALIVENMHDRPYVHGPKSPEITAAMTRAAFAVRALTNTVGIQVLSGGNQEAIAIAHAASLPFIRCENFVFAHIGDEGLHAAAEAGPLLRYRKSIGADHVKVFCDIKKKHASHAITADIPIADAVEAAEFFGADGVIITGAATGKPAATNDVKAARKATRLPILIGSGVAPDQVKPLFNLGADALIVGSWIKQDGLWSNAIDPRRCEKLVKARNARG